jgi:hypothetical protein
MYQITDYSFNQAKRLGVQIRPSTNKEKKIDVLKNNKKIASIGASGMSDYPTYIKTKGKEYADNRRRLFNARFEKSSKIKDSPAYFAKEILW